MSAVRFDLSACRPRPLRPEELESLAALLHAACRCDCAATLFAGDFMPLQTSDAHLVALLASFHSTPPLLQDHWRHVASALFGTILLNFGATFAPVPNPNPNPNSNN